RAFADACRFTRDTSRLVGEVAARAMRGRREGGVHIRRQNAPLPIPAPQGGREQRAAHAQRRFDFFGHMPKSLIALTGGTGFIGRYLLRELSQRGYRLRVLLRRPSVLPPECAGAVVGDL